MQGKSENAQLPLPDELIELIAANLSIEDILGCVDNSFS